MSGEVQTDCAAGAASQEAQHYRRRRITNATTPPRIIPTRVPFAPLPIAPPTSAPSAPPTRIHGKAVRRLVARSPLRIMVSSLNPPTRVLITTRRSAAAPNSFQRSVAAGAGCRQLQRLVRRLILGFPSQRMLRPIQGRPYRSQAMNSLFFA